MNASVIIPVRNGAGCILNCLRAVYYQEFDGEFEVIVVDDGSTDNTAALVSGKFPKALFLRQKPLGPAAARNNGAKRARNEIIVFTDADCVPSRNWLKEMLEPFSNSDVAGVQGAYTSRQQETIAQFTQMETEYRYEKMKSSTNIDWVGSYSAAYRKSVFLELGGFERSFTKASGEDPDLSYSLQEAGYILVFAPRALIAHTHPTSLYSYLRKKFQHAHWRILLYKRHSDKAVSDSYTPQLLKAQIAFLGLFLLFSALSLISEGVVFFAWLSLVLLLSAMIPFVLFALKRGFFMGVVALAVLFLRDIAFLAGLASGLVALILGEMK